MLLHDVPRLAAARFPDRPAVVFEDRVLDHAQLWQRVRRLGAGLARLVEPGDRVAVLATNRAEYLECYYGIPAAGALLTMLNYRLHPQEWAWILQHSEASVLVVEPALLDRLTPLLPDLPALRHVLVLPGGEAGSSYLDLIDAADVTGPLPAVDDDSPAWLIYTSGTTGRPKGALLSHRALLAAASETVMENAIPDAEVYLTGMPLCHVSGYYALAVHLRAGQVVLMGSWDAGGWLELVGRHGATASGMAPTMLASLLHHPRLDDHDLTSLRSLAYGGSAIPVEVLKEALDRFGPIVHSGYAATELSGTGLNFTRADHVRAADGDEHLLAGCGRPQCLVEATILDADGAPCPPDVIGELAFRSEHLFSGYFRDPERTAEAFTDGWFRTGDLGRRDVEGYFYVVDRVADMIITGGENVYSREVEDVLHEDGAVAEAAVVGWPDPYWGERVVAFLVPRPDRRIDTDAVRQLLDSRLARYKHPRSITVVASLPRTASGKILKRELRAQAPA